MAEITKPFLPQVNEPAVKRNPSHWPIQVEGFLECGYGGEKSRKDQEHKRGGDEHAPPYFCYQLSEAWLLKMDDHVSAYWLLPKGSFRDSALDRSAKNLIKKEGEG